MLTRTRGSMPNTGPRIANLSLKNNPDPQTVNIYRNVSKYYGTGCERPNSHPITRFFLAGDILAPAAASYWLLYWYTTTAGPGRRRCPAAAPSSRWSGSSAAVLIRNKFRPATAPRSREFHRDDWTDSRHLRRCESLRCRPQSDSMAHVWSPGRIKSHYVSQSFLLVSPPPRRLT